jgi:hypothetical protein
MNAPAPDFNSQQLKVLALRCLELADRVIAGQLLFIDAVDIAYTAAEWAGLTESVGDDVVQKVLAAAFMHVTRGST